MECNKDEAVRALQLAEKKLQNNDFTGALKTAKTAQRLFPELENISQLLTVCEVHCSAQNKIGGSEMDLYGILQVEQTVDVVTIKKQYRKLALLLHPDKNKFAGAEAAFKLIGEANRVLTDQVKRSLYETKCRTVVRTAAPNSSLRQSNGNISIQKHDGPAKNHHNIPRSNYTGRQQYQQAQVDTFWTCCPFCKVRYQYYKAFQDRLLNCQNCSKNFVALNMGTQVMPPRSDQSQFANLKEAQNQGSSKLSSQNNYGNPSGTKFASSHPVSKAGSAAELSGDSKMEEKDKRHVDVRVGKKGVEMPKSDSVKSKEKEPGTLKNANRKGRGKSVTESSESCGTGDINNTGDVSQENAVDPSIFTGGNQPRKSSRQKRNISYRENLSDDANDFVSPPKKPRENNSSSASEKNMKNASVNEGVSKDKESAALDGHEKEVKQNPVPLEEILRGKRSTIGESEVEGKEAAISDHLDQKYRADDGPEVVSNAVSNPEIITFPDPEFNDFDKGEKCFAVNQIWAVYDTVDGMPRFYARIRKVFSPGFKLQISWLEPDPDDQGEIDWCSKELPVGCGKYTIGHTEKTADRLMFSHQMFWINGSRGAYMIYPRKGETWALFQNWDINWFSDPEKHIPYQLEYVEVLSDFGKDSGIVVAYLCKVKGFVSLFQRSEQHGIVSFKVPPGELYRFSHRIPSFRMTGEEREGVPKGCFEFDPASLPDNFFKLEEKSDVKKVNGSMNTETSGFCPNSLESEEKPVMGSERIPAAKKHEKTDFKRETPIPRRSPRKLNSTNMDYGQTDANKSVAVDGIEDTKRGNPIPSDISAPPCEFNERVDTPWKEGNTHRREAVELRRSPRNLNKKDSQVNAGFAPEFVATKHSDSYENESHACTWSSPNGISSCGAKGQSSGKGQHSKSSRKCPVTSPSTSPVCKSSKVQGLDFNGKKSKEKFQLDQIWALYSDSDGLPKTYAQVKRIESTSDFQLHVALLEPCSPPNNMIQPVCCGTFRVQAGETKVFKRSSFSHCLSAEHKGKNKYEIYPREGEVWGLYKDQNRSEGEFYIVEVLENLGLCTRVLALTQVDGYKSMFKTPRIQRSKIINVPLSEAAARFSHQIQAFRRTSEDDSRLAGCWELDPISVSGNVVCLD